MSRGRLQGSLVSVSLQGIADDQFSPRSHREGCLGLAKRNSSTARGTMKDRHIDTLTKNSGFLRSQQYGALCCFCFARPWTRLSRCSVHGVCDSCSFQILERIGHECIICDSEVVTHAWKNDREAERGRILALDGGGVRGLIQLEVLAMLEEEIGLNLPLRCFFDLIVGTSIGEYWNDRPLPY